jgi:hypothetical protein
VQSDINIVTFQQIRKINAVNWKHCSKHDYVKKMQSLLMLMQVVQYSTVQYSTVQYSTVQYSTVQYSTVQYSTVQYNTVQYSTVQYNTVQYSNQCTLKG